MHLLFLLLLAGILISIPSIINKRVADSKLHGATYTFGYSLVQTLLCLPLLINQKGLPIDFEFWVVFLFSAMAFGISMLLVFESYKLLDVSLVAVIQRFNIVIIALMAVIFMGEQIAGLRLTGLLLIVISSLMLTVKKKRIQFNRGFLLVVLSAFFSALAAVLDKELLKQISATAYAPLNAAIITIMFMMSKTVRSEVPQLIKRNLRGISVSAAFGAAAWVLYLVVLKNSDVSSTYPIYKSLSLITPVVLGIIILKETEGLRLKLIATLLGAFGVILTSLS